ncbi:hypothetical protein HYH03_010551 [Edaphochlamys debaryana]|uniref:Ribosomal RNA-processing protein 44 n=1 Tax=Edaphochlamys debaryana TaxID=47281 RepID=A0A835XWV3_9CHLO|nr:hypothetical protein HYH03_010551 [Edaphochlamys debaryana]|eukprot:KAG2491107.1 hypothetical protein HYH03_010551 [Edaphochlamys debaryana]
MHLNKTFTKVTKAGKVKKVVREQYLRDDIWSGSPLDPACDPASHRLAADAPHYLLIDTNVALHQLDFLEHAAVTDVIVCSTVLDEVKHKNASAYQRLRAACAAPAKRFFVFANEHHRDTHVVAEEGESPNDRNDRALRVAARWYADRIPQDKVPVILLTNDVANRSKALSEGLRALGVAAYCRTLRQDAKELQDLVAAAAEEEEREAAGAAGAGGEAGEGAEGGEGAGGERRAAKRKKLYDEHLPYSELMKGIKEGRFHQGSLRVSRFNPFEGWVGSEGVGEDIMVSGRTDMNRAIDGDVVAVELLPEAQWRAPAAKLPAGAGAAGDGKAAGGEGEEGEEGVEEVPEVFQVAPGEHFNDSAGGGKRPTGRVVGIIRRNWRSRGYCGSLKPQALRQGGPANVLFMPVERRFPMIRIQTRQAAELMDKRIVVVMDGWDPDSAYPRGHYTRTLGQIGDRETETEVLLIENDINTSPFTPAVHDCVPPLPWSVTPADLADPHRMDLRHLCVASVDPPGCKDIDDALHVRPLDNGNYELGVHIADVTHFLRPATAMDLEAASRATTVYLVQRRIDMLPKPLTEDICSLRCDVERLAFSVLWEVDEQCNVLNTRFTKSVIKSRASLTYQEAQSRIDDASMTDELTVSLRTMNRLAKVLRARRAAAGALQLASPEVKFEIDRETHDPLDVGMYQVRETNQMVEEMMLLANIAVAEKTLRHFPSCALLRRHPTPPERQFDPILKAAASAGFTLDVSSSKALSASLDAAVRPDDPYFNKLVRIMATRCMTQATYFGSGDLPPSEYHHYGLAAPLYTHFTSPIRRYADVVVHRLLSAAIGLEPLPDSARDKDALRGCSDNLNKRHHNAQMAGRASVELHTLIFFKSRTVVADARVTRVKANGLVVFVPKYGIEGPVYLTGKGADTAKNNAAAAGLGAGGSGAVGAAGGAAGGSRAGPSFILDEEAQSVTAADGSVCYRVFDKCAVRMVVEEGVGHRRTLVLSLVPRSELPEGERMGRALVRHFGDALAALNWPGLREQLLKLPAAGIEALLESEAFGTDSEDSILTLLATWMRANWERTDAATRKRLSGLVRLAQLSPLAAAGLLSPLSIDYELKGEDHPAGWFPVGTGHAALLNTYAAAQEEQQEYVGNTLPFPAWYDMRPRAQCLKDEGTSYDWAITREQLQAALAGAAEGEDKGAEAWVYATFSGGLDTIVAAGLACVAAVEHEASSGAVGLYLLPALPAAYAVKESRLAPGGAHHKLPLPVTLNCSMRLTCRLGAGPGNDNSFDFSDWSAMNLYEACGDDLLTLAPAGGTASGGARPPGSVLPRDALRGCSNYLNKRHHNSQMAGRASVELHTLIFFKSRTVVADARVTRVTANGLVVFVPKYGIEGPVYLTGKGADTAKNNVAAAGLGAGGSGAAGAAGGAAGGSRAGPSFILDEEAQSVTAADGSVCYRVFDKCAVRIVVEEGMGHRRTLVLSLVPRSELPEGERMG